MFCQYKSYSASTYFDNRSYILQSCSVEIICSLTVNFVLFCRSALLCRFNIPGITNHSEAASLWLVRQDRATVNSGSPPSCGANFCSDRWLHRPRWVGWLVRYPDIYLFYVYGPGCVQQRAVAVFENAPLQSIVARAFQFAIRIDSFCKKKRPFDSLVVMQFFLLRAYLLYSLSQKIYHNARNWKLYCIQRRQKQLRNALCIL